MKIDGMISSGDQPVIFGVSADPEPYYAVLDRDA
jgi:hypothetical protein